MCEVYLKKQVEIAETVIRIQNIMQLWVDHTMNRYIIKQYTNLFEKYKDC